MSSWRNGSYHHHWPLPAQSSEISLFERQAMTENGAKRELFEALEELAELVPEMRTGQLMAAVGELCADLHGRGLWDASDAELLEAIWQFRRNFESAAAQSQQQLKS